MAGTNPAASDSRVGFLLRVLHECSGTYKLAEEAKLRLFSLLQSESLKSSNQTAPSCTDDRLTESCVTSMPLRTTPQDQDLELDKASQMPESASVLYREQNDFGNEATIYNQVGHDGKPQDWPAMAAAYLPLEDRLSGLADLYDVEIPGDYGISEDFSSWLSIGDFN